MGKDKNQNNKSISIDNFSKPPRIDYEVPGFLANVLCMAVQESHHLIALIDINESVQVYNLLSGEKLTLLSNKPIDEEVASRHPATKLERNIYYNLHFIENSNKVCFINGYRNEIVVYSIKDDITIKSVVQMPDGYILSCSVNVYDEKSLIIGN
jgi:hypothetical protein